MKQSTASVDTYLSNGSLEKYFNIEIHKHHHSF